MSLKLVYFKMRALAEAPQLLLHYAGIDYQYLMSWDYYGDEWSKIKPRVSFKQLPVLIVDETHEIAQSIAILSYIEKLAGLSVSDPIISAKADAILQSAQELFAPLNPTINFAKGDDFSVKRDEMTPFLLSRFDDFSRTLSSSGGKFFIDDVPRACDFAVFHHLDLSTKLDKSLLAKFPLLEKFVENIETIASVRAYLDTRPKLIDVSVMPKLVIDGVPHPTGIQKT
jgi:glutathione S-transferase